MARRQIRCARRRSARAGALVVLAALCLAAALPGAALAGGGPENVFLVVNARSWASLTLANHFIKLRGIPPQNVMMVDWDGATTKVNFADFRAKVLIPVAQAMQQRNVVDQIDSIVYSSDFPWAIDLRESLGEAAGQLPQEVKPVGSLTGLTYFYPFVTSGDPRMLMLTMSPDINRYLRRPDAETGSVPSQGFRGWYAFGPEGRLVEASGGRESISYVMSTMLGVTSGIGNSVDEIVHSLTTAAASDGTKPKGTIYFAKSGDIRSKVREVTDTNSRKILTAMKIDPERVSFEAAVAEIKKLGVNAEIVSTAMPRGKDDVQGLVSGIDKFDWPSTRSTIKPGAICENFTSFGGIFDPHNQTRLSEFIRYGAAASSGTVIEPYAFPYKFPLATAQVHYVRGCTVAEAFYQSTASPYQLLVVGDPLCQPWATIPQVTVAGVEPGATVSGEITLTPQGTVAGGTVDRFDLFVDGVHHMSCSAGESFRPLNTANLFDGHHEVRVVGFDSGPIETQGRAIVPIVTSNHDRTIEFSVSAERVPFDGMILLSAKAPNATKIVYWQGVRPLEERDGDSSQIEVPAVIFGMGPVRFRAIASVAGVPTATVYSQWIDVTIDPPAVMPGRQLKGGTALAPGMQLRRADGRVITIPSSDDGQWLRGAEVGPQDDFQLASLFDVPEDGVYKFDLRHKGPLTLSIDRKVMYEGDNANPQYVYVAANLGKGMHHFELRGKGDQPGGLDLRFGLRGAPHINTTDANRGQFQHPTK